MAEFGVGSDYKVNVIFTSGGTTISNPQSDPRVPTKFEIEYYTTTPNGLSKHIATRNGATLTKCQFSGEKLIVAIDKPDFSEGDVKCKTTFHYEDASFGYIDNERTLVIFSETEDSYVRV